MRVTHIRRAGESALQRLVAMFGAEGAHDGRAEDVTIVIADVVGYSPYVAAAGDDAAAEILDALDAAIAEIRAAYPEARLVERLGDGVMLVSTTPEAGLRLAAELPDIFADQARARGHLLRLRVGAHHGPCRRRGEQVFGHHVNVAALVAERAEGGKSLASEDVVRALDLMETGLLATPAGRLQADGIPEQPQLYLVAPVPRLAEREG